MVEVMINWIFISITSYALGYVILEGLSRVLLVDTNAVKHANVYRILLGLAAATVYAEVWSLFGPVGFWADCVLVLVALIVLCINNTIVKTLAIKPSIHTLIYAILILVFAYGTSRGYMHFDTNLYHAQAIRWIEEYGLVPGLANLQSRFGYNSAEFALNALYSCKWLLGRSLHCTAGYFALISSFLLVDTRDIFLKSKNEEYELNIRVSDLLRLGLFFYLATIYSEMLSPASDYYAQLLIFDIIILWLDSINTEEEYALQGILCIILVYAITIKLSLGLLVLLALIPGISWIRNKNIKSIIICTISGLIIALPYLIRNYIISGWILYPSTIIKLGSPDWQLPKGEAQYDAREIGMWGRGITSASDWEKVTMTNWIPDWIRSLPTIELMWVIGSLVAIIVITGLVIRSITRSRRMNELGPFEDSYIPILLILSIGTIFWFFSAPLVRYGYAYLIIMPLIVLGYILLDKDFGLAQITILSKASLATAAFAIIAIGIILLKGKNLTEDIIRVKDYPYYIHQQDYIDGDASSYEIDGITIYVAEDAGQIGYYKFPATPNKNEDIRLRGENLSQGFKKDNRHNIVSP